MALLYTNANIAQQLVIHHRLLGHDVLTSLDADGANPISLVGPFLIRVNRPSR